MTFEEKKLEEFDEQFVGNTSLDLMKTKNATEMRNFISQALKEQREEMVRKIEEVIPTNSGITAFLHKDNIIKLIQEI